MEFIWVYDSTLGPNVEITYSMKEDYFYDDFELLREEFAEENQD
jgi:hypothetical protein